VDAKAQLKAQWEDAQGRVKEAWGSLTDDDLMKARGNWDQLVAAIRSKTGEGVDTVEEKLNGILDTMKRKGNASPGDDAPGS
jgi:uncharacterized protein YjbJ (UPF0337 family)